MLFSRTRSENTAKADAMSAAVTRAQAIIRFDPNGNITEANENFLAISGYEVADLTRKHHSDIFSPEHGQKEDIWAELNGTTPITGEYKYRRKDGLSIYLQASYCPVTDADGKTVEIVCFATDVTEKSRALIDANQQLAAIDASQAVIEFDLEGTILTANENFLKAMGYTLSEVKRKKHRIFVDPEYADSPAYAKFWKDLRAGEIQSGEFRRIAKGGHDVWIQANYIALMDLAGRPYKIVKHAADITARKRKTSDDEGQIQAIARSQVVLEFELDGKIIAANDNFLKLTGYTSDRIIGSHYRNILADEAACDADFDGIWRDLKAGVFRSAEFAVTTSGGKKIWLQANLSPILGLDDKPYKIVQYATDVSSWKSEIGTITEALAKIAKGDLTSRLGKTDISDFIEIRNSFNTTSEKLHDLVSSLKDMSFSIGNESEQIAGSSQNLSSRCEHQAATVEETSAAMEEISLSAKSSAQNAKNATDAATNAANFAEKGQAIVDDAITAMNKIEEGSSEVRKIIEVIDAIAFQTNLLALNAGVEAARAGDAGRGFAVVASEVRALAQRASNSARDINALIESSGTQVSEGAALVNQTGDALKEIVDAVRQVSTGIDGIFSASTEQSEGVQEINQAIVDIDSTTQKTAAIAEENTAVATALSNRSTTLRELIEFFDLGDTAKKVAPNKRKIHDDVEKIAPETPKETVVEKRTLPQAMPPVQGALAVNFEEDEDDWDEF